MADGLFKIDPDKLRMEDKVKLSLVDNQLVTGLQQEFGNGLFGVDIGIGPNLQPSYKPRAELTINDLIKLKLLMDLNSGRVNMNLSGRFDF